MHWVRKNGKRNEKNGFDLGIEAKRHRPKRKKVRMDCFCGRQNHENQQQNLMQEKIHCTSKQRIWTAKYNLSEEIPETLIRIVADGNGMVLATRKGD